MLSLIILLPLAATALIWLLPDPRRARWVAAVSAVLTLCLTLAVAVKFDAGDSGFQFMEQLTWIPTLGIHYTLGVDGISVLFLPLTALLFLGVILASWTSTRSMPRLYFSLLLMLEGVTLGIFCALDVILFFLFWELTLVPLYFLVSLWGDRTQPPFRGGQVHPVHARCRPAPAVRLPGARLQPCRVQRWRHTGGLTFDYLTLLEMPLPPSTETLVFFLLLLGFAVKTPVFPLHTWLPVVAQEGPVAVVALLTGLKLGAYGLIRFTVPLAPAAAQEYHWLLAGLGVVGILYGAVLALAQTNLRRMLAFSSISHVGLVVLGLSSFTIQGIQGSLFQLLNFAVVAGGIFLLAGFLHHRIGSTDLISLGGAARSMPLLAAFFFLFGLAGMGVPATSGFPAEFLILVSALNTHTGAGLAALFGLVLGAGYFLSAYRRAFLGPLGNVVIADAVDLRPRELILVSALALLILAAGLYPNGVLDLTRPRRRAGWPGSRRRHFESAARDRYLGMQLENHA